MEPEPLIIQKTVAYMLKAMKLKLNTKRVCINKTW